jgi:hypothetical protein
VTWQSPGADLADVTGFSPEGVRSAMNGLRGLEERLTVSDWAPESLFGGGGKMADLFGVLLKVPQIAQGLEEAGGEGFDHLHLSNITRDWVNGRSLQDIAKAYFADGEDTDTGAFTDACKALYRAIVNNGTWGISALSRISGLDFDKLPEAERRRFNALPAMIYHGVGTEEAVLMRMNAAPRSVSENIGRMYRSAVPDEEAQYSVGKARAFLDSMSLADWDRARPGDAALSGGSYRKVWRVLSGEEG